jgi:hypothetical protein
MNSLGKAVWVRVAIYLSVVVVLWTLGVALSEPSRCCPIGQGFKVPVPLVLGLLASVPFALGLARIQISGDSFRHRLLGFLRHVPLAGAVAPVALTGVLWAILYIASLFERAIFSPRLLLELSGSVVLVVVFALSCCGGRKTPRPGIPSNPQDAANAAATPGNVAAPSATPPPRDRRPVCGILAWAAPMLAVPAGIGVIYGLASAFEGSEAMNDFKGMGTGIAIIGMGFVPLLLSVPTSLVLAIVSLRRRERYPGLAVALLAAYGVCFGFLCFGPWGVLTAYLVAVVLSAIRLARRPGRACSTAGIIWRRKAASDGSAGPNAQQEEGNAMTGKQMKMVGLGAAVLALWIGCIVYLEARSEHVAKSEEKISPPPVAEVAPQEATAPEAARLEQERQAGLAADAEADRLEQERQAKPAADAQATRLDQEREAKLVADIEAATLRRFPAVQVVATTPGTPTFEYKLTAIMGGNGKYRAFLNNKIYQAGDKLGRGKVLGIEAKEVTIETPDRNIVKLHIGESVTVPAIQRDASVPSGESATGPVAQPDAPVLPPGLRKGLLAYYPFNRNEGSSVSDLSDSRRNATAENVAWTPYGKVGGAMIFNPKGSRMIASDQGLPEGDAPRSIAFWKRTRPKNEVVTCLLTYGNEIRGQLCAIGMDWRVGRSGIAVSPCGTCNVAGQRLENDRWYHVVYCYGRGGEHTVYINGVAEPLSVREFSTFNTQLSGKLMLGDSDEQAPSYDGCLDEVMIYDRVLSPTEVRQIYERQ